MCREKSAQRSDPGDVTAFQGVKSLTGLSALRRNSSECPLSRESTADTLSPKHGIHRSVSFTTLCDETCEVPPYGTLYGCHPKYFDFDADGNMAPTPAGAAFGMSTAKGTISFHLNRPTVGDCVRVKATSASGFIVVDDASKFPYQVRYKDGAKHVGWLQERDVEKEMDTQQSQELNLFQVASPKSAVSGPEKENGSPATAPAVAPNSLAICADACAAPRTQQGRLTNGSQVRVKATQLHGTITTDDASTVPYRVLYDNGNAHVGWLHEAAVEEVSVAAWLHEKDVEKEMAAQQSREMPFFQVGAADSAVSGAETENNALAVEAAEAPNSHAMWADACSIPTTQRARLTVGSKVRVKATKLYGTIVTDDASAVPYRLLYDDGNTHVGWLHEVAVEEVSGEN